MYSYEEELQAIHDNLSLLPYDYVSLKQLKALSQLMATGLGTGSRKVRIEALRMIVGDTMEKNFGVEITSSKNITKSIASALINLFKVPDDDVWELSEYGKFILGETAKRIKILTADKAN